MLLRISSSPILNSWIPNSTIGLSPESDAVDKNPIGRLENTVGFKDSSRRIGHIFESDLRESLKPKKSVKRAGTPKPMKVKGGREGQELGSGSMLLSSSSWGRRRKKHCGSGRKCKCTAGFCDVKIRVKRT